MTGSLVSPTTRRRVRDLATPIARGLGRLGLTPNALTVIGFLGTCVAALAAAGGAWLAAGFLVLAFGIFDLFDGALARATGQVSRFGSFLDSTLDRAGEMVVYAAIVWACVEASFWQGAFFASTAMAASVMVSYARAKAESLGFAPGNGLINVGLAPREVRIVILVIAMLLTGLNGGVKDALLHLLTIELPFGLSLTANVGQEYLSLGLILITVLATVTTIQRILHVRGQSKEG
jgi:CDP-diacylglycerol--glycerol-3-phosphate 3-phosphatidyltransferase